MTPFDVSPTDPAAPDPRRPAPAGFPPADVSRTDAVPMAPAGPLPGDVLGAAVLAGFRRRFADQRRLAELALAQVADEDYAEPLGPLDPLAVQVKHVAGSLRSRFTDFLTTDGEKDDRDRDREFALGRGDTREALTAQWDAAWDLTDASLAGLVAEDLGRTVTIRSEAHTVLDALQRALAHVAYHTGQIVALAKYFAGDGWQTLSIPRGGSALYNAEMRDRHARR